MPTVQVTLQHCRLGVVAFVLVTGSGGAVAEIKETPDLAAQFGGTIRPIVEQYCLGCHSTEKHKGDLDLERFGTFRDVLQHPKPWQQVIEQINLGEMPPKGKPSPSPSEKEQLLGWIHQTLDAAALARAGDPGPVPLRRLNNAEYTYTLRDLTGVDSLDPAREFPSDSAAGEGFMNTGGSLVMSPALLAKYLDAAKEITSHAVLLPDGFRFSAKTTRRDWTEEVLTEIRRVYRQYTDSQGADKVNLQGIVFDTNEGGRLPLEAYLRATLDWKKSGGGTGSTSRGKAAGWDALAGERSLSPKYLAALWDVLNDASPSLILDGIRARWRVAQPEDAASLAESIRLWQKALWKFSSVGHIGKAGGPKAWMEPLSPFAEKQEFKIKLAAPTNGNSVQLFLIATDAGDGNAGDFVLWQQPRLVMPGRPTLPLHDLRAFIENAVARRERVFSAAAQCLAIADSLDGAAQDPDLAQLARDQGVDEDALRAWTAYLGLDAGGIPQLHHFTNQIATSGGYSFVQGWGSADTPNLVANASDTEVRIPGRLPAHSVAVHPGPKVNAAIGWTSPLAGQMRIEAQLTHAHPECGNGVEWWLELRRGKTRQQLAKGFAQGHKPVLVGPLASIGVRTGDMVSLLVGARDGNHSCDLTGIELVIREDRADGSEWRLSRDVSADVLAANPHADRFGHSGIWHFYTEPAAASGQDATIPAGSLLARWQSATSLAQKEALAADLQRLLLAGPSPNRTGPDAALYRQLASLGGPLFSTKASSGGGGGAADQAAASQRSTEDQGGEGGRWALDPNLFGKSPDGAAVDRESLAVQAPSVIEIRLPADLVDGAELVLTGALDTARGAEGSVQLQISQSRPSQMTGLLASHPKVSAGDGMWTGNSTRIAQDSPIIVRSDSQARRRIEANCEEFRRWFPAALCYQKIVPVDEVITLTLFHREDEPLCRLMLNDTAKAHLDRLWDELRYVSRDALTLVDAFEQLWQYATQDADPKVFEPLRQPIRDRAAALQQRLIDTQPRHIDALLAFAGKAYRRPLSEEEAQELRNLYRRLRDQEIPHEEAFQLVLARIFVAPAFLYRLEKAEPGRESYPVSDWELANRLSYFLWSSGPDAELRRGAAEGNLRNPEQLVAQARRMLSDGKVRRLAVEFGCAWLHLYDFNELNEKSERHFPSFAELRGPMFEEVVQYLTDLFRKDASVLEVFDSDHAILNERLAKEYGIPNVTGAEWRRVDGVKGFGRGGVLGFGATLARQSGASRTSPILRGNWIAEVLLGEKLPRPPKDVPRLPEDEATETLTVRQLVEKHSSDPRCATCHARIDGYGFALEGYDAIGLARTRDLAGRPIDTHATLFDGTAVGGAADLRQYLLREKRPVVLGQFCRKLLGYALGRGIILSDKPLIDEMVRNLGEREFRFGAAVETIVRSRQFQQIRGQQMTDDDDLSSKPVAKASL